MLNMPEYDSEFHKYNKNNEINETQESWYHIWTHGI